MAVTAIVGAAVMATGATVYASEKASAASDQALKQQRSVQEQTKMDARSQQRKSEEAINAANRRKPDVSSIMENAAKAAQGGPGGTMLTGAAGVDPNSLSLGKSTLLGG